MYTLEGVSSVANFITAYEEFQLNRDSHFLSVMCALFPKVIFLTFIALYTAAGISAVWRPYDVSPYFTIVQIIFPLGSLDPLWYIWKWSSAHVYARGCKQCCKLHYYLWRISIKPRLPFSSLLCVLCFQRPSFWRFFTFHAKCLLRRQYSWNVKVYFLGKIRKQSYQFFCLLFLSFFFFFFFLSSKLNLPREW